ncbi:hypothetical protein [Lacisediminihabitans profunda]|uniref:Uncharacterized protein n=1 Tax=Lacisediminihabitans profunda TaxID=2594790 RepID=A0A5C8UUV8_9MICO|nr:hypothetical protein [Lacisediminihabitans profunda]TXN31426.1 hypothetical protein FVP33_07720 [Lacisediminihabitans profunda]
MTALAHRVVRQRGFLVALAAASLVLAVLVVQSLLTFFVTQLGYSGGGSPRDLPWWTVYGRQVLSVSVPFGVGVLLGFWFIAPVAAELRLAHVITRSLLAAVAGAILVFLTTTVLEAVLAIQALVDHGALSRLGAETMRALGVGLAFAAQAFVSATPLVILAGILLWNWVERHPSRHPIAGIVDTA